jgi:hypothetical protein
LKFRRWTKPIERSLQQNKQWVSNQIPQDFCGPRARINCCSSANIIPGGNIKNKKMVTRMGDKKRTVGRPRHRQEDNIEIDVK